MAIVLPSAEFSLAEVTTLEGLSRHNKTISAVRFRRRLEPHDAALRPSVKRYSWHGMQEWSRWEDKRSSLESAPMLDRALAQRSEEHTSELQSRLHLVCRLLLEKKKKITHI